MLSRSQLLLLLLSQPPPNPVAAASGPASAVLVVAAASSVAVVGGDVDVAVAVAGSSHVVVVVGVDGVAAAASCSKANPNRPCHVQHHLLQRHWREPPLPPQRQQPPQPTQTVVVEGLRPIPLPKEEASGLPAVPLEVHRDVEDVEGRREGAVLLLVREPERENCCPSPWALRAAGPPTQRARLGAMMGEKSHRRENGSKRNVTQQRFKARAGATARAFSVSKGYRSFIQPHTTNQITKMSWV